VPTPPRNASIWAALDQSVRAARTERRCRVSRDISDVAESVENPIELKEMPILGVTYNPYGVKTSRSALTRGVRLSNKERRCPL
jgi:hypothetical protein